MPRPAKNKVKLTDLFCRSARCPADADRAEYLDAKVAGLTLRVRPNGHRSWSIRFRVTQGGQKGKQQRLGLGDYPAVSLDEARTRALELAAGAARGKDPGAQDVADMTFGAVLDAFIEKHAKPNQKRSEETERLITLHIRPALGTRKLAELRKADVIELCDGLQKKGLTTQINRVLSQLKTIFTWTVDRNWLQGSPAAGVRKPIKEATRERVLSWPELRALWHTADGLPDPSRSLVKAWMLTGQRRDEVRCLPPSEINPDATLWTLPASRNKAKREHLVPLSGDATALLIALRAAAPPKAAFLFSMAGSKPYAGTRQLKLILDRGMTQALRAAGDLAADTPLTEWVVHDIRRTVASGMAELRIPYEVISRCLNHRPPGGITNIYNRHDYLEEKRTAFEAWATRLASIVKTGRDAPNVSEFPARA